MLTITTTTTITYYQKPSLNFSENAGNNILIHYNYTIQLINGSKRLNTTLIAYWSRLIN